MDSRTLNVTSCSSAFQFVPQPFSPFKNLSTLNFPHRKPRNNLVFASKDDSRLDEWDQMELKFGRMLGEDPKTTLAKIMGRKLNPDLSYLEIEKLLEKKEGKGPSEVIEEIPFDVSDQKKSTNSIEGLNLVRPVPNKGTKFEGNGKTSDTELNLVRPVPKKGTKFEESVKPVRSKKSNSTEPIKNAIHKSESSVPDVILRKPSSYYKANDETSGLGMKPNISLRMGKESEKERYSDITLLKKPEPMPASLDDAESENDEALLVESVYDKSDDIALMQKPELIKLNSNEVEQDPSMKYIGSDSGNVVDDFGIGISNYDASPENTLDSKQIGSEQNQGSSNEWQVRPSTDDTPSSSMDAAALLGKPKRLDLSNKVSDQKLREQVNPENIWNLLELEKTLTTSPVKEREEDDWARAELLVKTERREEVELISSSTRGFVATFGSLIGFLPYRNLAARWKFLAFESWLRRKGLDPSAYRQNLGVIGKYDATNITDASELPLDLNIDSNVDGDVTSDMKLEDLLRIYDQEKLKFLSSFVGQRINVGVVLADRSSRKLIFSIKPKEKEELVERKRSLMAQLSVGDVAKCCIKKITYFGIFVEVEGVPALIHQTEVSWDATLDPASFFKVGQIVDAKVHQLDFSLERIFLSLKEITPDPMIEALEAVVGDNNSLDGRLQAAEADTEWADVESLIKELERFDGIKFVSKGRYFLSPGLAPTFQVYMASMFANQYKLLARAGNRVQEVIVQTSLGKEELKSLILTCANRVE